MKIYLLKQKRIMIFAAVLLLFAGCAAKEADVIYYCPMHPEYTAKRPGDCPICNMKLVKKEQHPANADHSSYANAIFLSEKERHEIGLRITRVERRNFSAPVRSPGQVAYDPELYAAMVEYRQAAMGMALVERDGATLLEPLAVKLEQAGLTRGEIAILRRGSGDPLSYLLRGSGSHAMVYLQVYESDIARLSPGAVVSIRAKAYPDIIFRGNVVGVSEVMNNRTRSFTARVKVQDAARRLKPRMFVEGEIATGNRMVIAVPSDALLDTGKRKIVFIADEQDHLHMKEVETGIEQGGYIEIRRGLAENQRVAAGAAFLLDSERRLRGGHEDY